MSGTGIMDHLLGIPGNVGWNFVAIVTPRFPVSSITTVPAFRDEVDNASGSSHGFIDIDGHVESRLSILTVTSIISIRSSVLSIQGLS